MARDIVKLDGENFTRDEVAMLYHASFYLTNDEQPMPAGHPPTPSMLAQMKLASVLGEDVPEAALQNVQRSIDTARERAQKMAQQRAELQSQRSQKSGS